MPSLPRWKLNQVEHCFNNINDSDDQEDPIFNSKECYACTQVGVPVFHSTHQPQLRWERTAGSSMTPTDLKCRPQDLTRPRAIDPRSSSVKRWNRIVLMARGLSIAVDPSFFLRHGAEPDWGSLLLHGRGACPRRHRRSYLLGRVARGPHLASVQVGLRVEGVDGDWVREASVGLT
ncbi:hypothetical protein L3X38_014673 [Prunus dulcis]|uniref:Uncharacterized protein n=1 Tax=Prunus dulcis TaxID=3755 RepID=A0AAD4ZI85_PRUDU|nr:hypothetical protein L3X38_014673 [Prunus dulcis]